MRAKALSRAVMRAADRHQQNGELTISELQTFLAGSEYEPFVTWMTFYYSPKASGRTSNFNQLDTNGSGSLDGQELEQALLQYLEEIPPERQFKVKTQRPIPTGPRLVSPQGGGVLRMGPSISPAQSGLDATFPRQGGWTPEGPWR